MVVVCAPHGSDSVKTQLHSCPAYAGLGGEEGAKATGPWGVLRPSWRPWVAAPLSSSSQVGGGSLVGCGKQEPPLWSAVEGLPSLLSLELRPALQPHSERSMPQLP